MKLKVGDKAPEFELPDQNGKKHKLSKSGNTTILVVTHDLSIAGETDKIFRLRDGKLAVK